LISAVSSLNLVKRFIFEVVVILNESDLSN